MSFDAVVCVQFVPHPRDWETTRSQCFVFFHLRKASSCLQSRYNAERQAAVGQIIVCVLGYLKIHVILRVITRFVEHMIIFILFNPGSGDKE